MDDWVQCWLLHFSCFSFASKNFCAKAVTDLEASELKFKMHYHDGVVCPNCMHSACNSMYFVRAAAVCTTSKQQKYAIMTLVQSFKFVLTRHCTVCDDYIYSWQVFHDRVMILLYSGGRFYWSSLETKKLIQHKLFSAIWTSRSTALFYSARSRYIYKNIIHFKCSESIFSLLIPISKPELCVEANT